MGTDLPMVLWFVETIRDITVRRLRAGDDVLPHAFILPATGDPVGVFAAGDLSPSERDRFALELRERAAAMRAVAVLFVTDMWMRFAQRPEGLSHDEWARALMLDGSVSDKPDRQEALFFQLEHVAKPKAMTWIGRYDRDSAGKPTQPVFEQWGDGSPDSKAGFDGRFANLLPRGNPDVC